MKNLLVALLILLAISSLQSRVITGNSSKIDTTDPKVELLNALRTEYDTLLMAYHRAKDVNDTALAGSLLLKRKLNNDSCLAIIGLSTDSLKSYRKVFESIEQTLNRDHSRSEEVKKAANDLNELLKPCLFIYLQEFYDRSKMMQKKLNDIMGK